jgi:hypothetical protein
VEFLQKTQILRASSGQQKTRTGDEKNMKKQKVVRVLDYPMWMNFLGELFLLSDKNTKNVSIADVFRVMRAKGFCDSYTWLFKIAHDLDGNLITLEREGRGNIVTLTKKGVSFSKEVLSLKNLEESK